MIDFVLDRMIGAGMTIAMTKTGGDPGHAPARHVYEKAGVTPVARYFKMLPQPMLAGQCRLLSVLSGLALTVISSGAFAAPLRIEIHGVVKSAGTVHIALFNSEESWDSEDADFNSQVPAVPGTTIALLDLPPGDYAFFIYDDVNGNDKLDKTWIGFPDEPYAFSNNVQLHYSKPSFSDLKFAVSEQGASQVIQLVEP